MKHRPKGLTSKNTKNTNSRNNEIKRIKRIRISFMKSFPRDFRASCVNLIYLSFFCDFRAFCVNQLYFVHFVFFDVINNLPCDITRVKVSCKAFHSSLIMFRAECYDCQWFVTWRVPDEVVSHSSGSYQLSYILLRRNMMSDEWFALQR